MQPQAAGPLGPVGKFPVLRIMPGPEITRRQQLHHKVKMIELGLDIPLLIASTVAVGFGTLSGEVGIWRYLAWKKAVPYWIKVGHAHLTWWTTFLMLAAILLPGLDLALWAKNAVVVVSFIFPLVWLAAMYAYYEKGGSLLSTLLMPIMEAVGFGALLVVFVAASGIQLPFISVNGQIPLSRWEMLSGVSVPSEIFLVPTIVASAGIAAAWIIAFLFYRTSPHRPIRPAALVQLHNHTAMISTSAVLMLIVLSVMGVSDTTFDVGYYLVVVSLPLLLVGLFAFVLFRVHSIAWVGPTVLFYLVAILAFLATLGVLPTDPAASGIAAYDAFPALRVSLAVALAMILITASLGPYIGLKWDKSPDTTVTYSQPEGSPYPGPYPAVYAGTEPVAGTPRGLENAHLSPGSWLHIVITWQLALMLAGGYIFGSLIHMPALIYLFAITIPMAPIFNFNGRILAWQKVPFGIGSLYFAGHPIKGFNILSLFVVGLVALFSIGV